MTSTPLFNTAGLSEDPEARERWWDPSDPRIFVPRAIGLGWDVNLGAIAVKLGWLREDDLDDDVISAIPAKFTEGTRVALAMSAGLAIGGTLVATARTGERKTAISNVIGVAAITGFAATRKQSGDRLVTSSFATGINAGIGLQTLESLAPTRELRTALKVAQPLAIFGLPLGIVTRGIKLGLSRVVENSHIG